MENTNKAKDSLQLIQSANNFVIWKSKVKEEWSEKLYEYFHANGGLNVSDLEVINGVNLNKLMRGSMRYGFYKKLLIEQVLKGRNCTRTTKQELLDLLDDGKRLFY